MTEVSKLAESIEQSATLALNARVKQMAAEGKTVYNLTAGEPSCGTPQYIQDYAATKLDQNHYTPTNGLMRLRIAAADYARDFYQQDWIKTENVVVTASVKPGLWAALAALINPGEEVILPVPNWVSYKHLINLSGAKPVQTKLDEQLDLNIGDIKRKITGKTKAIILTSPQNPTGVIYSADKIAELVEIVNKRNITVISDEIYSRLVFDDSYKPVSSFAIKNLVILDGFSKSQALTGWRIGFLIAEQAFAEACNKIISHGMGNAPVISQYAAITALKNGNTPVMFAELRANRDLACSKLDTIGKISYVKPGGAFYVFLDIRELSRNSLKWCEELLQKTGVALVPGEAFLAPGFARLSFSGNRAELEKGLELIKKFCEEHE